MGYNKDRWDTAIDSCATDMNITGHYGTLTKGRAVRKLDRDPTALVVDVIQDMASFAGYDGRDGNLRPQRGCPCLH